MHRYFITYQTHTFLSLIACIFFVCSACGQTNNVVESSEENSPVILRTQDQAPMSGFAILELFTSEGCSSCPPADRLLRDVIADSEEKGLHVFALSFHVDYWNRLGWKDPYSDASYSDRQRNYARALNSRVYTPQLVVNGKEEFVGSNRGKASMAIQDALDTPAQGLDIEFNSTLLGNRLSYSYKSKQKIEHTILNVAVVESDLVQEVDRGENRGRTLKHDNVVRAFDSIDLDAIMGRGSLEIPSDLVQENARIIFYAQDTRTKEVILAKAIALK